MEIFWDNDIAEIVYDYAWLIFFIGIIIIAFLGIKYLKNKKVIKLDFTFETEEKNKKMEKLTKQYILSCIIVIIISGVCFAGIRIIMLRNFSCDILPDYSRLIKEWINPDGSTGAIYADKPIIYLYPEKETEVTVKLSYPEKLTCSYPEYGNFWNVIAKPNGDLIDLATGRNLYALYWEGINSIEVNEGEGFVVKGEDTIDFLEEKLDILGLSERETNEFIVYWLPQMEPNEYNFIRFETLKEINENMPLEISPKPDSVIRVMMCWKPLLEEKEVEEQKLATPSREGFTVVEWGGSRID